LSHISHSKSEPRDLGCYERKAFFERAFRAVALEVLRDVHLGTALEIYNAHDKTCSRFKRLSRFASLVLQK